MGVLEDLLHCHGAALLPGGSECLFAHHLINHVAGKQNDPVSKLGGQETPRRISSAVTDDKKDAFAFSENGESRCRHGVS